MILSSYLICLFVICSNILFTNAHLFQVVFVVKSIEKLNVMVKLWKETSIVVKKYVRANWHVESIIVSNCATREYAERVNEILFRWRTVTVARQLWPRIRLVVLALILYLPAARPVVGNSPVASLVSTVSSHLFFSFFSLLIRKLFRK